MRPAPDGSTEACDIVVFADDTPVRMLREFRRFRYKERETDGIPVLDIDLNNLPGEYKGKLTPDRRYLASPQTGTYLAATNERLMDALVNRIRRGGESLAFPPSLPEWREIDLTAPAWAIRHYQRTIPEKIRHIHGEVRRKRLRLGLVLRQQTAPFVTLRYLSKSVDSGGVLSK